jgi:hypothetical protein
METAISPLTSSHRPLQRRVFLMPPPNSLAILQQLNDLNRSSLGFHDRLSDILSGEEYKQRVPNLQNGDLMWLVNYLDNVSRHVAFPCPMLSDPA